MLEPQPLPVNWLYSSLLFLATAISVAVFSVAWRRRKTVACARFIAGYSLTTIVWSFTYALHWTPVPRPNEFFWVDMTFLGAAFAAASFFLFSLCYVGLTRFLTPKKLFLFFLPPLLTLFFLYTDPWLGLFFEGKRESGTWIIYDGSFVFWGFIIYVYSLKLLSIGMFIWAYFRFSKRYRMQLAIILVGALLPVTANVLAFLNLSPTPDLDLTPISFSLTGIFFAIAILGYEFLSLMPVSRNFIFDNHRDAILIFNRENRVVDINRSAKEIFQSDTQRSLIGASLSNLQEHFPALPLINFQAREERSEFSYSIGGETTFEMLVAPLQQKSSKSVSGYILSLHDITHRKRAEQALRDRLEKIEALQNQLREEAIRDPLTSLYNRRYLHEILSHALPRAERDNTTLAFSLFDIDHFKNFNDQYGHDIGDEVLRVFSKTITDNARQGDIAFRFGGEEFLLLISGAKREDVKRRIDEIRKIVEKSAFIPADENIRVTFSAGIATFPEDGRDMDALFKVADRRLYLAKEAGRNRVYDWRNEI